ncbi:MAG TPA: DUF1538 domain-containing protein [Candidatus Mailhella merdavium]|nr:DUF1538 domain-containing protein [Candidatus Mailhella merdavium]
MIFLEKLRESAISVLPIMALVSLLHLAVAPLGALFPPFLLGGVLIIIGLSFFLVGADIGVLPMGQRAGSALVHKRNLPLLLGAGFIIGFIITVAEPDVQVLAAQVMDVAPSISARNLVFMIAAGVGLFVSLALLRVIFQFSLRVLLLLFYALLFVCAALSSPEFLGVGFDAGGATTGPMTVPFILALGMGVAAVRGGNAENDSFGFIGLASIGPIMAVLLMGMLSSGTGELPAESVESAGESLSLLAAFLNLVPEVLHEVLVALGPLFLLFAVFQLTLVRMPSQQLLRLIMGLVYTFLGLVLFFLGVKGGFMPAGRELGALIAGTQPSALFISAGVLFGALVVCAEPAVWVLTVQVEEISGGSIRRSLMLAALSLGVACAVGMAMFRILNGISLWYFLIPGYLLSFGLMRFCPPLFTAIAFDSGGVASGPMASTFILAFALGASNALGGNPILDAFGVIALIAMTPLIAIQALGILVTRAENKTLALSRHSQHAPEDKA